MIAATVMERLCHRAAVGSLCPPDETPVHVDTVA